MNKEEIIKMLNQDIDKVGCGDDHNKIHQLRDNILKMIAQADLTVPQAVSLLNNIIYGVVSFSRVVGVQNNE